MEMPRSWTENSIKRRIGLALLAGYLLKAIAAVCEPISTGRKGAKNLKQLLVD